MAETNSTSGGRGRIKRGLPAKGLRFASESVNDLWDVARTGLVANRAFAEKIGRKSASGGAWDALVATLRGFQLVRVEGEQIGLSDLGRTLINDSAPSQQQIARRQALLNLKAYRDLVQDYDGTELPDKDTIASRLKYEYGKGDGFAADAAEAFIDSLRFASMLSPQNIVFRDGADAAETPEDPTETDDDGGIDEEIDRAFAEPEEEVENAQEQRPHTVDTSALPAAAGVNLSVTLDLSRYNADDVVRILRALGHRG